MNDDMPNEVKVSDVPDSETQKPEPESTGTEATAGVQAGSAEPDESSAAASERRAVTLPLPLAAGLGLLLVFALVGAIVFGWLLLADANEESSRDEALATARAYAVTVTSYDYQDMDQSIADAIDGATGEFKDQYAGATEALKALMKETKATATGEVLYAAVTSATDERAEVLLFVDQKITNAGSKQNKVDRNRVLLTLEKHGDRWLASNLKLL